MKTKSLNERALIDFTNIFLRCRISLLQTSVHLLPLKEKIKRVFTRHTSFADKLVWDKLLCNWSRIFNGEAVAWNIGLWVKITSFRNVTEKSLKFMSKPQPFHSFKLFADEEDFAEIVYEKDVKILISTWHWKTQVIFDLT